MVSGVSQADVVQASRLRGLLYVALVVSAAVALFGRDEIQARVLAGSLVPEWRFVPGAVFGGTLLLYAVDRVLLVQRGRFPYGKAFYQLAFGLVLLGMHFQGALMDYRAGTEAHASAGLAALLQHEEPGVRAMAAELAGYRGGREHAGALVALLSDGNAAVQAAAQGALERLAGRPMGAGAAAAPAWRAWLLDQDQAPPPSRQP